MVKIFALLTSISLGHSVIAAEHLEEDRISKLLKSEFEICRRSEPEPCRARIVRFLAGNPVEFSKKLWILSVALVEEIRLAYEQERPEKLELGITIVSMTYDEIGDSQPDYVTDPNRTDFLGKPLKISVRLSYESLRNDVFSLSGLNYALLGQPAQAASAFEFFEGFCPPGKAPQALYLDRMFAASAILQAQSLISRVDKNCSSRDFLLFRVAQEHLRLGNTKTAASVLHMGLIDPMDVAQSIADSLDRGIGPTRRHHGERNRGSEPWP